MCVCVRACVSTFVRACMRACVCICYFFISLCCRVAKILKNNTIEWNISNYFSYLFLYQLFSISVLVFWRICFGRLFIVSTTLSLCVCSGSLCLFVGACLFYVGMYLCLYLCVYFILCVYLCVCICIYVFVIMYLCVYLYVYVFVLCVYVFVLCACMLGFV